MKNHWQTNQRVYPDDAARAAFPLGGIGTGTVSLGARGELRDWEIFNRPGTGNAIPYAFFMLRLQAPGQEAAIRVLQSRFHPPYNDPQGLDFGLAAGIPRFQSSTLTGEYPFARCCLRDDTLPVEVSLEAFTPLIPLNADDSGIPCAILTYRVKNNSDTELDTSIALSSANVMGFRGRNLYGRPREDSYGGNVNAFRQEGALSAIRFTTEKHPKDHLLYGDMCIAYLGGASVSHSAYYSGANWRTTIDRYWKDFSEDGRLSPHPDHAQCNFKVGAIAASDTLKPGETGEFRFIISWYIPNRIKSWNEDAYAPDEAPVIRNHYATLFDSAWDATLYTAGNIERLEKETRLFHDALFSSTLPPYVLDAVASNIAVLRSTTCFRIEGGHFLAWEGVAHLNGACEGTCTHVWNYAQTMAYLFPELEQSARWIEFNLEVEEDGYMHFRTQSALGLPKRPFHPASDGQNGAIIRAYREWKLSGDMGFLKSIWDGLKRAMDFNFTCWDLDGDFLLEQEQHNTYDIEFHGITPLSSIMFFGALKAMGEMCEAMGEAKLARRYLDGLAIGREKIDKLLWNGEYYIQYCENLSDFEHQFGRGCLTDQVFGQSLAYSAGLGEIMPHERMKRTLESIYRYNYKAPIGDYTCIHRTYAVNGENGLILCSWPENDQPEVPFYFCDEVWTGVEYQVAAHMIWEGMIDEGLSLVKSVRDRYDGYGRNPWSEIECGHHYARSLASWSVLLALSGFHCDAIGKKLCFRPAGQPEHFRSFWSCADGWGVIDCTRDNATGGYAYDLQTLYGNVDGYEISVG